jgi:hypothetical protein
MTKKRQLKDWLQAYLKYTDLIKLEAPDSFHLWTGISTIASVLERKVWYRQIPTKPLYSNQYIVLVGPPGRTRKGGAISCGEYFVNELHEPIHLCADSATRKGIVRAMLRSTKTLETRNYTHSSLTATSKELGDILNRTDPLFMSSLLQWWDCGDSKGEWKHETEGQGTQLVQGVWFNLLGATVPPGEALALSPEVIASGFSARTIFVYEEKARYRRGRRVKETEEIKTLRQGLIADLNRIHILFGEYDITDEAEDNYVNWYEKGDYDLTLPSYVNNFHAREHSHVLKLAMVFAAARRDSLLIEVCDLDSARYVAKSTIPSLAKIFGGVGRSSTAADMNKILLQIQRAGRIERGKLLSINRTNTNSIEFKTIIDTLVESGAIQSVISGGGAVYYEERKKKKEDKS